jgi:hypothetical protein
MIISSYCGLSSLVEPESVTNALCSCVKMDSCLIKQPESLMEISCDAALKSEFEALSVPEFWIYIKKTEHLEFHNWPLRCFYFFKRYTCVKRGEKVLSRVLVIIDGFWIG